LLSIAINVALMDLMPGMLLAGVLVAALVVWQLNSGRAEYQTTPSSDSVDLVRKLALVNQAAQNAMFHVDQNVAFSQTCQTASSVTQADQVALFLAGREGDRLQLVESIGFNEAEKLAGQSLAFPRAQLEANGQSAIALAPFNQKLKFRTHTAFPLRSGNAVFGYLALYHQQPHEYSDSERELLEILVNQLVAAVDNAHLLNTLEFQAFEMNQLARLSRISTASLKLHVVANDVTNVLLQMTRMDWAMIATLDPARHLLNVIGMSGNKVSEEVDTIQYQLPIFDEVSAVQGQRDTTQKLAQRADPGISDGLKNYMTEHGLQTMIVVPMIAHQDSFGMIFLAARQPRQLTDREAQLIEAASNQVATQIYNALTYQETYNTLKRQLQRIGIIRDIAERISSSHDFNVIIQEVFGAAIKTTRADTVALALLTESDDFWVIEQVSEQNRVSKHFFTQPRDIGLIGEVARTGQTLFIPDHNAVSYYTASQHGHYLSSITVPLKRENLVFGVLKVESKIIDFFSEEQIDFLSNLGGHTIISIENTRLLEELEYQIDILSSLRRLSLLLLKTTQTRMVARSVIQAAMSLMQSQYAGIFEYNSQTGALSLMEKEPGDESAMNVVQSVIMAELAGRVAKAGDIQIVSNVATEYAERFPDSSGYTTIAGAPIKRDDRVNQVLCLGYSEKHLLDEREVNTLQLLAIQAAGHLENAALHETIHEVNNRLRAILDSTRDGVILLDERGQLIEVNPAAQRLLGLPLREHLGESFVKVLLDFSERDSETTAGYSAEELNNLLRIQRLSPQGITKREFSRKITLNQTLYIEEIGSPVIDETHEQIGRLLVLRDITEQRTIEEYRNEITGMAVHDLRAPLTAIVYALQTTLENIDTPQGVSIAKRSLSRGLSSANEMLELVGTLLDIRKGKAMALERTSTAIDELIETAQMRLLSAAERANIQINLVIPPSLPTADVDPAKIVRVIVNLLDNAIRFTPAGGKIQISVDHQSAQNKILVRIADSGPGIPEKERVRVFEQFWQSKEQKPLRGNKGSGIGLAFCQRVLEAHGERIWIEPHGPLPGACFAFTLPVA
jgi:PAS domain S-box-containing protein